MKILNTVKLLFKKYIDDLKKNPVGHFVLLLIVVFISYSGIVAFLGPEIPGAFLERTKYNRSLYVLVFPDKNSTKNYRIPGDVTRAENGYTIESVTWPNGGYSTFYSCPISLNSTSSCVIQNSRKSEALSDKAGNDPNYQLNSIKEVLDLPVYYIQPTNSPV